jgi:PAS domain S-box-containing protein
MAAYGGVHPDGRRFEPDDYPIIRALRTGEVVGGVHMRYRRPDGSVVDLDVHAGPVWGHDGRIVAAVGMAFDITDRMAAERRLHESETRYRTAAERLRAAIDAGGLGIWELDLVTRSIQMDATMATMLGMDPVEVVLSEAEFRAFIHPDDYEPVRARMEAAIAAGGAYGEECRMVTTKGDVRWIVRPSASCATRLKGGSGRRVCAPRWRRAMC